MSATQQHQRSFILFALLAIIALGLALRLWGINRETAWNDEALSLRYLDAPTYEAFATPMFRDDDGIRHVPVYFMVQYGWSRAFGPSVTSLRMLSIACSAGAGILLYLITRRLASQQATLAASALYAMSLPNIYYAQEVRFYALVTLLVMASNYCFVRAMQGGSRGWWWKLWLVDAVLPWTHVFGPLIWMVHGVFLLLFRREWRQAVVVWIVSHALITAVFALWLGHVAYVIEEGYTKQVTPTWRELLNAFNVYAGGRFEKVNPALYLPTGISFDRIITVVLALLLLMAGVQVFRNRAGSAPNSSPEARESYTFALIWLLLPPLFLFAVSQLWKPFFLYRYTLYCSLGWYVIAGMAFDAIPRRAVRVAFGLLLTVLFAHQLAVRLQPFRPDYRAADAYIREHGTNADEVFTLKNLNGVPYRFNSTLPSDRIHSYEGTGEYYAAAENSARKNQQAWLILWQFDTAQIETYFRDAGFQIESHTFAGIPPLYLYCLRPDGYSTPLP